MAIEIKEANVSDALNRDKSKDPVIIDNINVYLPQPKIPNIEKVCVRTKERLIELLESFEGDIPLTTVSIEFKFGDTYYLIEEE